MISENDARRIKRAGHRLVQATIAWERREANKVPFKQHSLLQETLRFEKARFRITVDRLVERKAK